MVINVNKDVYSAPMTVTEQFFFCGVPFRLDTYNGCSHNCQYCFSRASDAFHDNRQAKGGSVIPADIRVVKRAITKALDWKDKSRDIAIEWLRQRVPLHWGGMSNPFQPCERQLGYSKAIMERLAWYRYPTVISTKGTLVSEDDYMALLEQGCFALQISLISQDDKLLSALEPTAPSAKERLTALDKLAARGLWTACRIQPMIPASPIEREVGSLLDTLAGVGVKHVIVEGYKPPIWNPTGRKLVNDVCGGGVDLEYRLTGGKQKGMETLLPSWRKWEYIQPIKEKAHSLGMTYGAADNDFRDIGDGLCCCGIDNLPGFGNFWRYQSGVAADIARRKGLVRLDDMALIWHGDRPFNFNKQGLTFEGNTRVRGSVKYYIDKVWQLGDARSPNAMVNMKLEHVDGQVQYRYVDQTSDGGKPAIRQHPLF